jgi:heme exporter protein A
VFDNLMFYARLYRVPSRTDRIREMIERVDLEAKTSVPVRALSRGMRQRLSLARAFIHKPSLLLLDEPFTGLDERASEILDGFLDEFVNGGGAVIMTTHDIERGWRHAHRVAVLDRGTVVYETSAAEPADLDGFREKYREILHH